MSSFPYPDSIRVIESDGVYIVTVFGNWKMSKTSPEFDDVSKLFDQEQSKIKELKIVLGELGKWDSSLLIFLEKADLWCEFNHVTFDTSELPPGLARLIDRVRIAVDSRPEPKAAEGTPDFATEVGKSTISLLEDFKVFVDFMGEICMSLGRFATGRSRMRWVDFIRAMQDAGAMSLPIVGLISFLIGVTLAFQAAGMLFEFGTEFYTPPFVSLAMVREMGPIMTGIIVSGRTGARFAATLGSMKVSEEIDALNTLGVSPIDYLVLPRILGLCIMVPLLVVYADTLGIIGGMLVSKSYISMPFQTYLSESFLYIDLIDVLSGLAKAFAFGLIIAYAGCLRGMNCDTSSTGVGNATTSAVVTSLTMIIVANALFALLYSIFGI